MFAELLTKNILNSRSILQRRLYLQFSSFREFYLFNAKDRDV